MLKRLSNVTFETLCKRQKLFLLQNIYTDKTNVLILLRHDYGKEESSCCRALQTPMPPCRPPNGRSADWISPKDTAEQMAAPLQSGKVRPAQIFHTLIVLAICSEQISKLPSQKTLWTTARFKSANIGVLTVHECGNAKPVNNTWFDKGSLTWLSNQGTDLLAIYHARSTNWTSFFSRTE